MAAGDSTNAHLISAEDRDLVKRLTAVVLFIFLFTAAFSTLDRVYSQKFLDITGAAKWIWARHPMSEGKPVAFFAVREFDLPESRHFTHLKVLGDPEYAVYLNGVPVAARHVGEERTLDVYDVSSIAHTGRNRVVIAVRAPKGAGGLIAAIDIAPENANWAVTDESWRIYRNWTPSLLVADPAQPWEPPLILGEPPHGRWNYLTQHPQKLREATGEPTAPLRKFEIEGLVPTISLRGGIAVAGSEKKPATVFDFGPVRGRLRVSLDAARPDPHVVPVRFANHEDELGFAGAIHREIVFAPGETVVTLPDSNAFRFAMLFDRSVEAEVLETSSQL